MSVTVYLLCAIWLSTARVLLALSPKCNPLDNVFYHKQLKECLPCNKCPVGFGKISLQEWHVDIDSINGPSSCIPCRPCKSGTYSDVRAYQCKPCTNCTRKNMYEVQSCSSRKDTFCDAHAPNKRNGSEVKKNETNEDEKSEKTRQGSITEIVLLVVVAVLASIFITGFGWKFYRKKRGSYRTTHATETGEYGSQSSFVGTPQQDSNTVHMCNESCSEDDEETPLISQPRERHCRKRKRHFTYPFTAYSKEEDLEPDFIEMPAMNSDYRHSYPKLTSSHNKALNNVLDLGFADFTLRGEPHIILKSFNITDKRHVLEKVKVWDLKYKCKQDVKSSTAASPYNFLQQNVKGQESILEKVKQWEGRDLTPAFLSKVSRHLGNSYRFRCLAREAGLSDTDLTNIQQNFRDDVVEQGYQVLLKLKHKEVIMKESDLIDILQTLGYTDIVSKMRH